MANNLHNDLLPLVFAAVGIYLGFRSRRAPASTAAALILQAIPFVGFWLTRMFC
jgi:hypothetical protein